MGLGERVLQMHKSGMSSIEICRVLNDEGFGIKIGTLKYHLRNHVTKPARLAREEKDKIKEIVEKEKPPELKLLEAAEEAYRNYQSCLDVEGKVKPNKNKEATDWFTKYSDLMEKQLKASGIYERAKQEAQKDQDKYIEILWEKVTICSKCGAMVEKEVEKHEVLNLADMQAEDLQKNIASEMTGESSIVDGKPEKDE
jgi:hypothetical protein